MDNENHNVHTSKFDAILDCIETKFDILLMILSERFTVDDNIREFENNSFKIPETGTPVVTTTSFDKEIVFDGGREFKEDEHHLFDKIPQWSNFGDEEGLKNFGKPMVTDDLERNDVDFNYIETELLAGIESKYEYQEITEHESHEQILIAYPSTNKVDFDCSENLQLQQYSEPLITLQTSHIDEMGCVCFFNQIDDFWMAIAPRCTESEFNDFEDHRILKFFEELKQGEIAIQAAKSVFKSSVERVTGFKGGTISNYYKI